MFVVIYTPSDDEVIYSRRMGPYEKMDLDKFARQIARDYFDAEIDESGGYIPNCSGDFSVEFRPRRDVSWHIWSGQSYYLKRDEE